MTQQEKGFKMKYKVGDKVRVRSDLVVDRRYGGCRFALGMKLFEGKILNISRLDKASKPFAYRLQDATGFWWTDEMLEPIEEFSIGDTVYAKDSERPLTILRKAWVVCYQGQTEYEHFVDERYLSKTKPLQKITRKELAEKGYELVD